MKKIILFAIIFTGLFASQKQTEFSEKDILEGNYKFDDIDTIVKQISDKENGELEAAILNKYQDDFKKIVKPGIESLAAGAEINEKDTIKIKVNRTVNSIAVSDNEQYLFIGDGPILKIFDITNIQKPNLIKELPLGKSPKRILVANDDTNLIVMFLNKIQIYDISNITNPSLIKSKDFNGENLGMALTKDGHILITNKGEDWNIIALDMKNLTEESMIDQNFVINKGLSANFIGSKKNNVLFYNYQEEGYQGYQGYIGIFDITEIKSPKLIKLVLLDSPREKLITISKDEKYLIAQSPYNPITLIYDISDLKNPELLSKQSSFIKRQEASKATAISFIGNNHVALGRSYVNGVIRDPQFNIYGLSSLWIFNDLTLKQLLFVLKLNKISDLDAKAFEKEISYKSYESIRDSLNKSFQKYLRKYFKLKESGMHVLPDLANIIYGYLGSDEDTQSAENKDIWNVISSSSSSSK